MDYRRVLRSVVLAGVLLGNVWAGEWTRFRGPNGTGVSDETGLPATWSETENLAWKTPLPGAGASSPILWGGRIFLTCYSGYGLDRDDPGDQSQLQRHLICVRASDGKMLWNKSVGAVLPEEPYKGMMRENGYASQTPVTDGRLVYVLFGKTGVIAFDMEGNRAWQTSVGTGSAKMHWGSAASPILYRDLLLVNAWDESKSLVALSKQTGKRIWQADLSEAGLSFSTPVLVDPGNGQMELVVPMPGQVWGLSPETGEKLWSIRTNHSTVITASPIAGKGTAYVHGGGPQGSGSLAVRAGGKGDVTDTHVEWTSSEMTGPPSPVLLKGLLYWVDGSGKACCMDAKTGELRYSEQLPVSGRFAAYASVVAADQKLYAVTRTSGTFVLAAEPRFKVLAHNTFASDDSEFNASPAISDGRLFLRSDRFLYCLEKAG